jgi:hypothetical protein
MYSDQPPKFPALRQDCAARASRDLEFRGDLARAVLDVHEGVFQHALHASYNVSDLRSPSTSGRPARAGLVRSMVRSSIGSTWYFSASVMNRAFHVFQLRGLLAGQVFVRLKSFLTS